MRRGFLAVGLAALVWVAGGCGTTRTAGVREAGWRTTTLGLCEDYPEESRSLAQARNDLALASASGAKVLRIAFGWDAMEPQPGVYDWSFWDEFVQLATRDFGVQLIPYICYTPRWAAADPGDDFWRSPPRDPEDFGRFVRALVTRYRHAIRSWELWNEPDNRAYWLGDAKQFAALVRAGSAAVRAADPEARVVLGGIATELSFLEALFEEERIAPAVDVVNLHSYFETWHPDPIERLPDWIGGAAEIVREHGENEPLWLAETGYSSVGGRADVSEVYRARFIGEHTPEAQAAALVRTIILGLATERLESIAWYRINDLPPKQDVIGDDNNRHLGVRRADGAAKPAQAAFAHVARLFAEPFRVLQVPANVVESAGGQPVVRGFALRSGRRVIAGWLAMPDGAASTAAPERDDRRATVRLTLPGIGAGAVTVSDATGRELGVGRVKVTKEEDGLTLEVRLEQGGVVLVTVAAGA